MPAHKKTIHITGGCGYVGSRIAVALVEKGYHVVVIDKATPEERGVSFPDEVEYRGAELTKPSEAQAALHDARVVFHFAANIGPVNYMWERQAEILWENAAIDTAVYPALRAAGCELLFYSSTSMVFQHAPRYPYEEKDLAETPTPTNVYGFSKFIGEYFCRSFRAQYRKLQYVILRFHNIYGPGEDSKGSTLGDIHVIPALLEKVLRGKYPLPLIGNANATRPFTYIDDAITMTLKLFDEAMQGNPNVLNTDFNVASGEAISIKTLAETIWTHFGDTRPFAFIEEETDASRHTSFKREANTEKLKKVVGTIPLIPLEEGIKRTAVWVREKLSKE